MNLGMLLLLPGNSLTGSSEDIQTEYIAIFIAALFPGALVAFDYDSLQAKPRKTSLRIYCAGIWHNAVFCAACGLVLLLLPFIFSPLYVHGEGPMVLVINSDSPLSDYLSPGDVIVSLDGIKIQDAQEWIQLASLIDGQTWENSNPAVGWQNPLMMMNRPRGYCVPTSLVERSSKVRLMLNGSACTDELNAFVTVPCDGLRLHHDGMMRTDQQNIMFCMNANDIVRSKRCDGLESSNDDVSSCMCSEEELCLSPAQLPGVAWVEIAYKKPYSQGYLNYKQNNTMSQSSEHEDNCERNFLYVGNVISMAQSLKLTAYQPRFAVASGAYLPYLVEKLLMCTFHVSLTLALLNTLPVYFLDGESILDVSFCYLTFLSPRSRKILLQVCLIVGSAFTCLVFFRNLVLRIR